MQSNLYTRSNTGIVHPDKGKHDPWKGTPGAGSIKDSSRTWLNTCHLFFYLTLTFLPQVLFEPELKGVSFLKTTLKNPGLKHREMKTTNLRILETLLCPSFLLATRILEFSEIGVIETGGRGTNYLMQEF